jgi:hypothetical protein
VWLFKKTNGIPKGFGPHEASLMEKFSTWKSFISHLQI